MPDFSSRLAALRARFTVLGYDGYLVPMADEYQSEYVPASAQRIEFLSGFSGSAGFIAILKNKAAFFTDGRYTLQAAQQVPSDLFSIFDTATQSPGDWLTAELSQGQRLAFDPWLHTDESVQRLKKALSKNGAELLPLEGNLVDAIWTDRPAPPTEPVLPYDLAYAGKTSAEKCTAIAAEMAKSKVDAAIVTDTASIAWLLNVRGNDVPNTPLPLSYAILHSNAQVDWFLDPRKISDGLKAHVGTNVFLKTPQDFATALDQLADRKKNVRLDATETASWIAERLRSKGTKLDLGDDPTALMRACKNAVELEGMRNAHRRDGVALTSFLGWLNRQEPETLSELDVEAKLASFRAAHNLYRGPSFDTIAGAGPHGAIVHYRAIASSNRKLSNGELLLLDSGGQYLDGTTDVTRTVAIGTPSEEMRDRFTRVLKGHIALASIHFPEGTTGAELDILARQYLWSVGLDFNHGTGHGVGSYLGVHEGPQGISKRNKIALKPGMVISNEPGFYKVGEYGIRIENLQVVVECPELSSDRKFLGFETLTLAPIDTRLIQADLMTKSEWNWLKTYHQRISETVGPELTSDDQKWLLDAFAI